MIKINFALEDFLNKYFKFTKLHEINLIAKKIFYLKSKKRIFTILDIRICSKRTANAANDRSVAFPKAS